VVVSSTTNEVAQALCCKKSAILHLDWKQSSTTQVVALYRSGCFQVQLNTNKNRPQKPKMRHSDASPSFKVFIYGFQHTHRTCSIPWSWLQHEATSNSWITGVFRFDALVVNIFSNSGPWLRRSQWFIYSLTRNEGSIQWFNHWNWTFARRRPASS